MVWLALAAPTSFLASADLLHAAVASPSHFFRKDARAAPANFLAAASALQVDPAWALLSAFGAAVAPVAPELLERFARFEALTLLELRDAFEAADGRFREWVRAPENAGRPISEAPDYLDRIALDSLLERRTWAE